MRNPLVSVIIPTYNRAHLIGETLDSILNQTYQNWECIIVDDGSTDSTEEIVNAYVSRDSRFQYHQRPDSYNSGGNGARNYGFGISRGIFMQWFDDDDIMLPEYLSVRIPEFDELVDLVICTGYFVDCSLRNHINIPITNSDQIFKDYILWNSKILTPSILFRKSFLESKRLFSDKIERGQETEFFSRLFFKLSCSQYKIISRPLFLYRQHEHTKSEQNTAYLKSFKRSLSYIGIENLKRSILIKDIELINVIHVVLLDYFFRGLENRDVNNSRYIFKELFPLLKTINKKQAFEFYLLGNLFLIIARGSYKIEKRWKKATL